MAATLLFGLALCATCLSALTNQEQASLLHESALALSARLTRPAQCEPAPSLAVPAPRPPATADLAPPVAAALPQLDSPIAMQPALLNLLAPPTHDPAALWDRAERLARAGFPIVRMQTTLSQMAFEVSGSADLHARVTPAAWPEGAIRLLRVPPDSVFARLGLATGDVLVAINGRSAADPDEALASFAEAKTTRSALLEVIRDRRWLVIRVRMES